MTDEQVQQRIDDYAQRYQVKELNEAGFPIFPAGQRETAQHREWIALYQLFNRSQRRSGRPDASDNGSVRLAPCPVCLKPARPPGSTHKRCAGLVDLVRELGPESLDRVRDAAFPGDPGSVRARVKRKA